MQIVWDQPASLISGPDKGRKARRRVIADKTLGTRDTDGDAENRDAKAILFAKR